MKFQVRDGFIVKLINKIDLGNDRFEYQDQAVYGNQVVDLGEEDALNHAHKLEPKDKDATAFLAKITRTPQADDFALQALIAKAVDERVAALTAKP